jgi:hypothetical protein
MSIDSYFIDFSKSDEHIRIIFVGLESFVDADMRIAFWISSNF